MSISIPFDNDLVDTIQEHRVEGQPVLSNPGLAERILAAIYDGIDTATEVKPPVATGQPFAAFEYHDDPTLRRGFAVDTRCTCGDRGNHDYYHQPVRSGEPCVLLRSVY